MTDLQIIERLIARDEVVTQQFFYKDCRPLFRSVIYNVFQNKVEYDELINELYLYLMENDAYRLKQFEGRSSLFQWIKVVAIRYFIEKRDQVIEKESENHLLDQLAFTETIEVEPVLAAKMDVERLFRLMPNKRYVYVIQRLVLDDANPNVVAEEMDVTIDNLYNIKKRAMAAITAVALNEMKAYEHSTR